MVESLLSNDKNNKIIIVAVPADRSVKIIFKNAPQQIDVLQPAEPVRSKGKNYYL